MSDPAIADTTLLPHPYPEGLAERWLAGQAERLADEEGVAWAIAFAETGELCGAIGLKLEMQHARGELVYWLSPRVWNQGYATEAARAVLDYAFGTLELHRVQANHFTRNPMSGRVLEKLGMRFEGVLRGYFRKGEVFEDAAFYGILRADWLAR